MTPELTESLRMMVETVRSQFCVEQILAKEGASKLIAIIIDSMLETASTPFELVCAEEIKSDRKAAEMAVAGMLGLT